MNRSSIELFLRDHGFSAHQTKKLLNQVKSVEDLVLLARTNKKDQDVLLCLVFKIFGFTTYKREAFENVWLLLKEEKQVKSLEQLAKLLKQDCLVKKKQALINLFVNIQRGGTCKTFDLKNFLAKYNITLDWEEEDVYTSEELQQAIEEIHNYL